MNNHTGTHLLNYALMNTLIVGSGSGSADEESIDQKGSLVAPEKFRFDFNFKTGLSLEQIEQIEGTVNEIIQRNDTVYASNVGLLQAKGINNLRAVFGESYPDPVRVVSVGVSIDDIMKDSSSKQLEKYSIELCGGTHVPQTGQIGSMVITQETSISKGIRRIIGVTGPEAVNARELASDFERSLDELVSKVSKAEWEEPLKRSKKELEGLAIGCVTKQKLQNRVTAMTKDHINAVKEAKALELKQAGDALEKKLLSSSSGDSFISFGCPVHGVTKNLVNLLASIGKSDSSLLSGKVIFLYGLDEASGRFHLLYYSNNNNANNNLAQKIEDALTKNLGLKHYKAIKCTEPGVVVLAAASLGETATTSTTAASESIKAIVNTVKAL